MTTRAPLLVAEESVALVIEVTPATPKVPLIEVLPVAPRTLNFAVSLEILLPTKRPWLAEVPPM